MLSLTWSQVHWESKVIRIDPPTDSKRTKGEDAREIPFEGTPLEDILKERWEQRNGSFVFHRNGKPIRSFHKVWRSACKGAGLEEFRLHDFRRTAARELVNDGVPEKVVMQIVGWKTRAMFDRYHIVNKADVALAIQKRARYGTVAAQNTAPTSSLPPKSLYCRATGRT